MQRPVTTLGLKKLRNSGDQSVCDQLPSLTASDLRSRLVVHLALLEGTDADLRETRPSAVTPRCRL